MDAVCVVVVRCGKVVLVVSLAAWVVLRGVVVVRLCCVGGRVVVSRAGWLDVVVSVLVMGMLVCLWWVWF